MDMDRKIPLSGAPNTRDLGGLPTSDGKTVKRGLIYRSGELSNLSLADEDYLCSLPLKTIIDFRSAQEKEESPDIVPSSVQGVIYLPIDFGNLSHSPNISPEAGIKLMEDINRFLAGKAQNEYRQFFRLISNPDNYPLLYHCTAGKDRVGFASAMLLSALGVARNVIYEDYLLSTKNLKEKYAPVLSLYPEMAPLLGVQTSFLNAAFEHIDANYQNVEMYLTKELEVDLPALRAKLTE